MVQADGVLVVDKPPGITSHTVVSRVRRVLRLKVGHLGTLDPAATGVLPLVVGRATRLARFMQSVDKEYLATIRLGKTTDTYDADGRTVRERPLPIISTQEIDHLLSQFRGPVKQLAPMFSAVKVGGERLYKAARRGELRERPLRVVHIYELELLGQQDETWEIRILCSSGTYVRSLAHDLGEKLGCGAHLQRLRRTRSGDYHLSGAVPLGEFEEEWESAFVPINQLLPVFPVVTVNKEEAMGILQGNPLHHSRTVEGEFCRLFFNDLLLAIGKPEGSTIYPKIVLRREI